MHLNKIGGLALACLLSAVVFTNLADLFKHGVDLETAEVVSEIPHLLPYAWVDPETGSVLQPARGGAILELDMWGAEKRVLRALPEGDANREYARIITEDVARMETIINDLLDLSKIEADKIVIEIIECSLSEILDSVEALMKTRAREKGTMLPL